MHFFQSAKERSDSLALVRVLLKAAALPQVIMLALAGLLAGLAWLGGQSEADIAFGFIVEVVEPGATITGALLYGAYLAAASFFVLPSLSGTPVAGVGIARLWVSAVRWILRAVMPQTIPAAASIAPSLLFRHEPYRQVSCQAAPFTEGRCPQQE